MADTEPEKSTLAVEITADLHLWLKRHALDRGIALRELVQKVLERERAKVEARQ